MRLATYNVENLFARARALNLEDEALARSILEMFAELTRLFEEPVYTDASKARMLQLLTDLGIDKRNDSRYVILRENRGQLLSYSKLKGSRIVAGGRADWVGWLEMKKKTSSTKSPRATPRRSFATSTRMCLLSSSAKAVKPSKNFRTSFCRPSAANNSSTSCLLTATTIAESMSG